MKIPIPKPMSAELEYFVNVSKPQQIFRNEFVVIGEHNYANIDQIDFFLMEYAKLIVKVNNGEHTEVKETSVLAKEDAKAYILERYAGQIKKHTSNLCNLLFSEN